jgi:hypothetical protein
MWNFVLADKAQLALSAQTRFHIQKCNTCRVLYIQSRTIICSQWYSIVGRNSKSQFNRFQRNFAHSSKFWDTGNTHGPEDGPDIKVDHLGSRPWEHHHTSSAHPPRCLVRCKCKFPRSFIISRRSASRALKRFSAVHIAARSAVSEPFLGRKKWEKKFGLQKGHFWHFTT